MFSTDQDYIVSDPSKIEVADGVVKLVDNGGSYATDNPYVINKSLLTFTTLSGFSETYGSNNQGSAKYQITNGFSDWYNQAWLYRQKVNVSGSTSQLEEYQLRIQVNTAALISAGKLQSQCQDIRVINSNQVLPYWIETGTNGCNTTATNIWVKVPVIPTSGITLYVYYGNSSVASIENPNDVFTFFDGFNGPTLDTSKWTNTGGQSITNGELLITTGSIYSNSPILATNQNTIFEMRAKWASSQTAYSGLSISNTNSIAGNNANSNKLAMLMSNSNNIQQVSFAANGTVATYDIVNNVVQFTPAANTYYVSGFSFDTSSLRFYQNRSITNSYSTSVDFAPYVILGYFTGSAAATTNTTDITIDYVLGRQFASSAPSALLEAEEAKTGDLWYWWDGSNWVQSNGDYSESNTAAEINTNISSFPSQIGTGKFAFKAFLHSDNSTQQVELANVSVDYFSPTAPTISSLSSSSGSSIGLTDVTLYGTNFVAGTGTKIYDYTGSDQTYTVPAGVNTIRVKMWGAGGGGGNKGGWTFGYQGGGGGYTEADISVTPGQVLTVMVGAGGSSGLVGKTTANYGGGGPNCGGTDCQYGGQGGGRSAIRIGTEDIATAGGGGGGGSTSGSNAFEYGGGGGGSTGESGISPSSNAYAGKGGTQSSGGAAGSGSNIGASGGQKYLGGRPNSPYSYGGSGGGGWFGGGAGAYTSPYMGGGGGGSGYIEGPGVGNGYMEGAVNRTPGKSYDVDNGGAGYGGNVSENGAAGRVVIETKPFIVKVGGVTATNVRVLDSGSITFRLPPMNPGTYDVQVTNPDGQTAILPDSYTYVGLTVDSLSETEGTSLGGKDVTITGTNFDDGVVTNIFEYTGSDQTYTVPEGVTSIRVKMWGAGGGGGHYGGWTYGYPGGGGGYTEADITVTPGQKLFVVVGQGGSNGSVGVQSYSYGGGGPNCGGTDCRYGGQGGGRSAIKIGTEDILTAGGGGGGGATSGNINDESGGGGGGTTGQTGISPSNNAYAGKGGTQSAGGAAGSGSNIGASAGQKYIGGRPNTPYSYGGAGGGGYFGGGGGAYTSPYMGGGGGGSSFISGPGVSNGITIAANGSQQAKAADVFNNGAGQGGNPSLNGSNGRVIIETTAASVKFGDVPATNIRFINSTTLIATTPAHDIGTVDITVTNPDGQTDILENAYTYTSHTITNVTPNTGSTSGETEITITGNDFSGSVLSKTYTFTSSDQFFTVPEGVTSVHVKMWGAGGGGGNAGGWGYGYPGGGGGYTESDITVTPGDVLTVVVGSAGNSGSSKTQYSVYGGGGRNCIYGNTEGTNCVYGGQGGGRSAIRIGNADILTAGGGGGGGSSRSNIMRQTGGAGGGLVGQKGLSEDIPYAGGHGGTQNAGGAGWGAGVSGSQYTGASHSTASTYGGSGGGGWYGGATGTYVEPNTMGGGGGGSSYIGYSGLINPRALQGKLNVQANSSDIDNGGAGAGGLYNAVGSHGKVIISAHKLKVTIGGIESTDVHYIDSNTITAKTPAYGEGSVDIVVTNPNGETAVLEDAFTYVSSSSDSVTPNTGSTNGGTQITITGENFYTPQPEIYDFLGADQSYTVPAGVTSIKVKMWGAGGGGGDKGGWTYGHQGGAGGYTEADLAVTPGQVLTVMVGGGGHGGNIATKGLSYGGGGASCINTDCKFGGQGGGRSAIRFNNEDILTAGGGGAGGTTYNNTNLQNGGGGGGILGETGYSADFPLLRGIGGGQNAGGAGGIGTGSNGGAGSKYTGGSTLSNSYGGGGGGGWYGGGSGGHQSSTSMGGGGGGSSYIADPSVIVGTTFAAVSTQQPKSTDPLNDGAGRGGFVSAGGRSGRIVIIPNPISVEIGGIPAKEVTYVDENTISAIVPANTLGTKDIVITNSDGTVNTLTQSFTYTGASVDSLTPSSGPSVGGTQVTISGTTLPEGLQKTIFEYSGKDQKFVVPEGVSEVLVKMWGGGGGGGDATHWGVGYPAGGGGYTSAIIPVTEFQELTVMVGAGGFRGTVSPTNNFYGGGGNHCNGNCNYGGQGGGRSAIRINNEDILTAGAGGGGGSSRSSTYFQSGGAGGGLVGQDGLSLEVLNAAGKGGTQTEGGARGVASGGMGTAGSKYTGGNTFNSYGGSGGGGWYGGGAGAYQESNTMGGGGGGSSYIGYSGLINPVTIAGDRTVQGNASDPDNGGAGAGGGVATNGTPGRVVITAAPVKVYFGSEQASNVQWIDENTIIATTSNNTSGIKDVTVVTSDGQSYLLPSSFTFVAAPTINSISPANVVVDGGYVTINGSDFQQTPTVTFDGVESAEVIFIDTNTLSVLAPAHSLGRVNVTVTNPDGQNYTLVNEFAYTEAPPVVNSIEPNAGPTAGGTDVSITGENFVRKAVSQPEYIDDGLLIEWLMNNDSGNTVSDTSGNGINGSAVNSGQTLGYIHDARTFNGSSSYIVAPPNLDVPFYSEPFTVSAWIYPTNHTAARDIVCWGALSSNNSNCLRLSYTSGTFQLLHYFYGNDLMVTVPNLTNKWSYVSVTFDGFTRKMYLNGNLIGTNTTSAAYVSPSQVYVGSRPGLGEYFAGKIDQVLIYDRALSEQEVQQNYSVYNDELYTGGLNAYYPLDENNQSLTNLINSTPVAYLGVNSNSSNDDPTYTSGSECKSDGCLNFDGVDDYVNVASNFYQSGVLSVSLWFKTTGSGPLMGQQSNSPGPSPASYSPTLWIMSDGRLRSEFYINNSGLYTITTNPVNDGNWHHVVLTANSTTQSLYLDGSLVQTRAGTLAQSWWSDTSIGAAYLTTGRGNATDTWGYFNGTIDDVRFYSNPLSSTEVTNLYNLDLNNSGSIIEVLLGEFAAESVNFIDSQNIDAVTPENSGGLVDVTVINPDGLSDTLENGFRYFYDKFSIISPPQTVRATEPATITVQAQDINGNPILLDTDITLNLSSTSTSGFFAIDLEEDESTRWDHTSITVPAGTSNATFYYKDNEKGTPTITAESDGGSSLPATQQITIKSKYVLLVTGVTNPVKLGVPSSVTVISTDYLGNPQHDYQGTIHFSSSDPATILPADFTYELSMLGEHTFVNGVTMVTQGEFCVTATDINDSDITGSQCEIVVDPPDQGTISQIRFLNGTQTIPLDGKTTEITVQAQDVNGTGIPVQIATPIYFYTDSSTGEFSLDGVSWNPSPFTTEIPAYATSKNFFYRDPTLGAHTIIVRDDIAPNSDGTGTNVGWENDQAVITTAVGSANKLALTGLPSSLNAGVISNAISISMQDIDGNNLTATQDKTVYLTSSTGNVQFSVDGTTNFVNSLSTKIKTGDLTTIVYIKSTVKENVNIILSDASPADGVTGLVDDNKSVAINSSTADKVIITNAPSELIAGDISQVFTAQLQDQYNNPVTVSSNFPVYLSAQNSDAQFSATSFGTLITSINIPAGNESVNFYYKQNKYFDSQTIYVSDTVGGFGAGGITDAQVEVDIQTGTVSSIGILESSPYSAIAGNSAGPLTAVTRNTFNVEVPISSDLDLYFYTNSSASLKEFSLTSTPWTPVTTHTLLATQSRFTFYYKDNKTGTTTIRVSDDDNSVFEFGLTNAALNLNISSAAPSSVKFFSSPQSAIAGIATDAITVTLYDQYNNIATSTGSRTISLSSSSATGRFDTQSNGAFNGSITTVVITNGQTSRSFYYKDTTIGTPTITLTSSGITGDTQIQNITAGTVTSFALTSTVNSVTAGNALDKFTLRTYNAGNVNIPVPSNFVIDLASTHGSTGKFDIQSNGSFNGTITSVTVPMNQNFVDFYYKDTLAGSVTITASKSGYTNSTKAITVNAGTAGQLAFRDAPVTLNIGQKSNQIYIQSQDIYGNPTNVTSNTTIYLHSNSTNYETYNSSNVLASTTTLSTGTNQTFFYYKDFNTGTPTITVSDYIYPDSPNQGLINATQTETINYGVPSKINLSSDTNNIQVGVPARVVLKLLNQYDQEVPATSDTVINLQSSSGTGSFSLSQNGVYNLTSVTVPNGSTNIEFYYKDTIVGSPQVSAIRAGLTTGTITFALSPSDVFSLVFASLPQTVEAGTSSNAFTVQFRDEYGNYTNTNNQIEISLNSAEPTGLFAADNQGPWNVTSIIVPAESSSANFYYQDTVSGVKQISILAPLLTGDAQNVTIVASEPTYMQFVPNQSQTVPGQIASAAITVVLFDQYNNIANAENTLILNLSSDSQQYEFSETVTSWNPITSLQIQPGFNQALFYYKDWIIGTPTITVSDNSNVLDSINIQFEIIASDAANIVFESAPKSTFVNTPTDNITFFIGDENDYETQLNSDAEILITSSSLGGEFSIDNGENWVSELIITIPANSDTSRSFIYVDSLEGSPIITISATGLTTATQTQTVTTGTITKVNILGQTNISAGDILELTVQTLNDEDIPVSVQEDTIMELISSSVTGEFSLSSSNWIPITQFTLNQWQNQKVIYYKDNSAGSITLTVNSQIDNGWTDGVKNILINSSAYFKIIYLQKPTTVVANDVSTNFVVHTVDQFGNLVSSGNRQIYIHSAQSSTLSTDGNNFEASPLSIEIGDGSYSGIFYYKDILPGNKTITASDSNPLDVPDALIVNAVANINVLGQTVDHLTVTTSEYTGASSVTAGQFSGVITVQASKQDNSPAIVGNNLTINLSTIPELTGLFKEEPDTGSTSINSVTIPIGESSANVYYTNTIAGTVELNFNSDGITGTTQDIEFVAASAHHFTFLTSEQTKGAGQESNQFRVNVQDEFGNTVNVPEDITIELTSNSLTGEFSALNGGSWNSINSITLYSGN